MLYDNSQMSISILTICLIGKFVSAMFYILGYFASKKSSVPDIAETKEEMCNTAAQSVSS